MKQTLEWFKEREMDTVIRVDREGREAEKLINNEKDAEYFHSLQNQGYRFKAKVRIHKARPEECESCSA